MPILLQCECGKRFRVRDGDAGKRLRCSGCGTMLAIPGSDAVTAVPQPAAKEKPEDIADVVAADRPPPWSSKYRDPEEDIPLVLPPDPEDEEDDRPEPRRKRRRRRPRSGRLYVGVGDEQDRGFFSGFMMFERGLMNAGVQGGVIIIVVALVWLVLGLMVGYLFYYPLGLLVVGVIAIAVGVVNWYRSHWE